MCLYTFDKYLYIYDRWYMLLHRNMVCRNCSSRFALRIHAVWCEGYIVIGGWWCCLGCGWSGCLWCRVTCWIYWPETMHMALSMDTWNKPYSMQLIEDICWVQYIQYNLSQIVFSFYYVLLASTIPILYPSMVNFWHARDHSHNYYIMSKLNNWLPFQPFLN